MFNNLDRDQSSRGFTLIEVMLVMAIIATMTVFLSINLKKARIDVTHTSNFIVSIVRQTQNQAVSGIQYGGSTPCGYGIHAINATQFALYVGPSAAAVTCSGQNKNYTAGTDTITQTITLPDNTIQIKKIGAIYFRDIFFEPPQPKVYVNNSALLTANAAQIQVGPTATNCTVTPSDCRTICVYTSGKIESINSSSACPAN